MAVVIVTVIVVAVVVVAVVVVAAQQANDGSFGILSTFNNLKLFGSNLLTNLLTY